jgi:hypothetical protein
VGHVTVHGHLIDQLVKCLSITSPTRSKGHTYIAAMSTSHPVSPMMARRHHTLHPSNLNTSRSNGSLASMNIPAHNHKHRMNRSNKTTGGYTTRDETEVEHTAKSPVKKAIVVQDPKPLRQLVIPFQVGFY